MEEQEYTIEGIGESWKWHKRLRSIDGWFIPEPLEWFLAYNHEGTDKLRAYLLFSMGSNLYRTNTGYFPRVLVGKTSYTLVPETIHSK